MPLDEDPRPARAAWARLAEAPRAVQDFDKEDQPLYLVFGGRVEDTQGSKFVSPDELDVRGIYSDAKAATDAWRGAAQATVDDAKMRYVVVKLR